MEKKQKYTEGWRGNADKFIKKKKWYASSISLLGFKFGVFKKVSLK